MNEIIVEMPVDCLNRHEIPKKNETIKTDFPEMFTIPHVLESISEVNVYYMSKDECPFNRGNWIIDIVFGGHHIQCIKLPSSMPKDAVDEFIKPLVDALEKIKISNAIPESCH
jgi:hypothetical protein